VTALFEVVDDGVFMPLARARGPWDPSALHGGPAAALMARAVESADGAEAMNVARLTVELLRPVPVAPLRVTASVLRPGRKVQLVGASITPVDSGVEVARAVALLIRAGHVDIAELHDSDRLAPPPPMGEAKARPKFAEEWEAFHNEGVEMRFTEGAFHEPGPAVVWMRLCQPVVEGEAPSPVQRVASHADFGNGVSSVVPWAKYLFINPDLTIHLARPPVGEWVCLEARSMLSPGDGMGMAESALYDESGRIGRSVQSLLVDRR
jgi:Thioesterase-like superfamily